LADEEAKKNCTVFKTTVRLQSDLSQWN